jgi:long-subunit fatty acid transport protein
VRAPHSIVLAGAALAAILAAAGEAAATNGAKLIATGARANGRGGTDTGIADDASSWNTNPGGVGFIDGNRADSALAAFTPHVRWTNPVDEDHSGEPSIGAIVGGSLGVAFDFDDSWKLGEALSFAPETYSELPSRTSPEYAKSGLKFGFGAFPISGAYVHLSARSPLFDDAPKPPPWDTELKEVAWTAGLAWRITHYLSVGLAPQFITGLPGFNQLAKSEPVQQPASILKGHPFAGTNATYGDLAPFVGAKNIEGVGDMSDMHTYGFRLRLGVLAIPAQWEWGQWAVGLSYASQSFKQDYLGKVKVDFTQQIHKLDPNGTAGIKSAIAANTGIPEDQQTYVGEWNMRLSPLNAPQEVSLGTSVQLARFLLALDVTWINWSATEDKIHGRLTNGTSRELNELIGGPDAPLDVPLDWKDQVVVAFGASVAATDWLTLRAGYNYGPNPVPTNTLTPTLPAILEHHATLGATLSIRRVEITLAYEHAFTKKVHIGDNNRANTDVSNSDLQVDVDAFVLGAGVRF